MTCYLSGSLPKNTTCRNSTRSVRSVKSSMISYLRGIPAYDTMEPFLNLESSMRNTEIKWNKNLNDSSVYWVFYIKTGERVVSFNIKCPPVNISGGLKAAGKKKRKKENLILIGLTEEPLREQWISENSFGWDSRGARRHQWLQITLAFLEGLKNE